MTVAALTPGGSRAALLDVVRSPVASAVVGLSVSIIMARRERDRTHGARVAPENPALAARPRLPEPHGAVCAWGNP